MKYGWKIVALLVVTLSIFVAYLSLGVRRPLDPYQSSLTLLGYRAAAFSGLVFSHHFGEKTETPKVADEFIGRLLGDVKQNLVDFEEACVGSLGLIDIYNGSCRELLERQQQWLGSLRDQLRKKADREEASGYFTGMGGIGEVTERLDELWHVVNIAHEYSTFYLEPQHGC